MNSNERPSVPSEDLRAFLSDRAHYIEGLVTPYLDMLRATDSVAQFESRMRTHNPADNSLTLKTDLSFRIPSFVTDVSPYSTVQSDEQRYEDFRGSVKVFHYDVKTSAFHADYDALYTIWSDVLNQERTHRGSEVDATQKWRLLLNEEVLADARVTSASAQLFFALAVCRRGPSDSQSFGRMRA